MKLVIAEKPSAAMAFASVLGASRKREGFTEGDGYLVSWCLGHLARLADARHYDPRYAVWRREDLPILPSPFSYEIIPEKQKQFAVLKALMHREDVTEVINACDAGREGELIFRTVYSLAGCSKPMKRLWLSSMEEAAIREGFAHLRPGKDFDGLYQSARCRGEADWLVGINASRFFSLLYGTTLNVGRVMSPTLAMLVQREAEIAAFTPERFYTVTLDCGFPVVSERIADFTEASKLASSCQGGRIEIADVKQVEKAERPPQLYDLTAIQRDANRLLGYTAQQALDYLQSLYEKKLCTYPRTDSRYLTDDMLGSVPELAQIAGAVTGLALPASIHADAVCDSKKVSDHYALIPTGEAGKADLTGIPAGELAILRLVCLGLLKAVSDTYRYSETTVTAVCSSHSFTAKGRTTICLGWKAYDKPPEEKPLPELALGQIFPVAGAAIKEGQTAPPKPYSEDTILGAMETAGDVPQEAERKGLGTPATRASTLEKLISAELIQRKKRKKQTALCPTALGMALITILPEQLQSPQLTAEWEQALLAVQSGRQSPEDFTAGICAMLRELFSGYAPVPGAEVLFPTGKAVLGQCPRCGQPVTEAAKGFFCQNPGCRFALWKDSKFFAAKRKELTAAIVSQLLKSGSAVLQGCYSPKTGKIYGGSVVLEDDGQSTHYRMVFDNG